MIRHHEDLYIKIEKLDQMVHLEKKTRAKLIEIFSF